MSTESDLDLAKRFHGHLGPNLIAGMRMGRAALKALEADKHFGIEAQVGCADRPPGSCVADGVQFATGCTLGKRNIALVPSEDVWLRLTRTDTDRSLVVRMRPGVLARAMEWLQAQGDEAAALRLWELPDDEILQVAEE